MRNAKRLISDIIKSLARIDGFGSRLSYCHCFPRSSFKFFGGAYVASRAREPGFSGYPASQAFGRYGYLFANENTRWRVAHFRPLNLKEQIRPDNILAVNNLYF